MTSQPYQYFKTVEKLIMEDESDVKSNGLPLGSEYKSLIQTLLITTGIPTISTSLIVLHLRLHFYYCIAFIALFYVGFYLLTHYRFEYVLKFFNHVKKHIGI